MISLHIKQLAKSFGTNTVFSDLWLEFNSNVLGIGGPNGSGKSTLLKCLGNLLRPTSGTIEWQANGDVLSQEAVQQKLGYAAPYINLYDQLGVRENLQFLAKMRHREHTKDNIEQWISEVGLAQVADQPFGKLSTGQQQRLRLAAALFHQPDILLLDEPGSNLDEEGRTLIAKIVKRSAATGRLCIIASNNPEELDLCERVFSMEQEIFV